jgi:hypothetical protein
MPLPEEDEFELRRRAQECRAIAKRTPWPSVKQSYLELAEHWTSLADERVKFTPKIRTRLPFGLSRH